MEDLPQDNQATPAPVPSTQPPSTPAEPNTVAETKAPVSLIPAEERMMAAMGYVPMGFVIPLIIQPKSKFCQMHAKQGMVLTGITFFILFVLVLIPAIGSLLFLALIAAIGIGGFQAYSGLEWKVPVLTDIAIKINVESLFAGTTIQPTATKEGGEAIATPEAPQAETPSTEPPAAPAEEPPKPETPQT